MSEKIIVHDGKTGRALSTTSIKEAHNKQFAAFKAKKKQLKHKHINVALINLDGEILTAKNDFEAISNADLIDNVLTGHVYAGHDNNSAASKIAGKNLNIPIIIVSKQELLNIIINHPELLKKQAFIVEVGYNDDYYSTRIMYDGNKWKERRMQYHYIGVYDGPYSCREGVGIQPFSIERLKRYLDKNKDKITYDIEHMFDNYEENINDIISVIKANGESNEDIPEVIECYDLKGKFVGTVTRKEAHIDTMKRYRSKKPQRIKHKHVGGLLVGGNGEIYLQIRSKNKAENPSMFDKIAGGHIPAGDSEMIASYHEFYEEMGIPSAFFDPVVWKNFLINTPETTKIQAICKRPILIRNYESWRVRKDGQSFMEICDQYFIIGRYAGQLKFVDKEAAGVYQFESREVLAKEIKKNPKKFTEDLKYMIKLFWDELTPINN